MNKLSEQHSLLDIIYIHDNLEDELDDGLPRKRKKSFSDFDEKMLKDQNNTFVQKIYYSISSVEKFMKNLTGKIHIISISRLDHSRLSQWAIDKIVYVDPKNIVPCRFLTSWATEGFFHLIPNISNFFLYFKDNCFLGNYIKLNYFYDKKKSNYKLHVNKRKNEEVDAFLSDKNYKQLLVSPALTNDIIILNTQAYELLHEKFKSSIYKYFSNKNYDMPDLLSLVQYMGLHHGLFIPIIKKNKNTAKICKLYEQDYSVEEIRKQILKKLFIYFYQKPKTYNITFHDYTSLYRFMVSNYLTFIDSNPPLSSSHLTNLLNSID